jgi:serine/threonine protein kinase
VGVYKVIEFIPKTQTINQDRRYFIDLDNDHFIKIDENVERGRREAKMLKIQSHTNVQKYVTSSDDGVIHRLVTEYFRAKTLEDIIHEDSLNDSHIFRIELQLLNVLVHMKENNIVHGDINISNILYDGEEVLLIDWETSYLGDTMLDILGPPTPTNHCGVMNVIRIIRSSLA